MKKFIKSFLMAAAALMLLAGCNGLIDATVSGDPDKAVITIGIDGITEATNRSARTINPEAYDTEAKMAPSNFTIKLKGYSDKGYTYGDNENAEVELTWNGTKATINLEYDVWYLTMIAYDKSETPKKLFEGRRRIDLRNGKPADNAFTFTLSTEGVDTKGKVNFSGLFVNPLIDENDANKGRLAVQYTAALYDLYTNEMVEDSKVKASCTTDIVQTKDDGGNVISTTTYGKFTYNPSAEVDPGRYNFRIYFDMDKGTGEAHDYVTIGTWNDIVVVAPGRTTNGTEGSIGNIGDILNKIPDAPTALSAYYVGDPTGKTSGNDYKVLINWTPSASKNESYYKLIIKDWTSGSATDYKVFDATHEFYGSDIWVDGTLAGGTNSCTVKLPVGKKYEITLSAVNVIGESAVTARKTTEVTTVAGHTAYGAEKINLMKIAYDLNGGTLKTAANESQVGGIVNKYCIFKDVAIPVMDIKPIPETGDPEYPQLTKQNHPFLEWDDETGTKVETITTFGNKNLTANYNVQFIIDYTIDDSYGSIDTEVKQSSDDVKNTVLKDNESNVTITVKNDSTAPAVTHIRVCILGLSPETDIVIDKDSSSEIVIDTQTVKSLDFRTYTVQVIATKADGKLYSNTFAITKQR